MRGCRIQALIRRRSRRERKADGSCGGSASSSSGITMRSMARLILFHLQQRAVATEAGAERRHPPQTSRRPVRQRRLQDKQNGRAAHVSVIAQHGFAPAHVVAGQLEFFAQGQQHVASARMKNPAVDLRARRVAAGERVRQKRFRNVVPPAPALPASKCCATFRSFARTATRRGRPVSGASRRFSIPRAARRSAAGESTAAAAPSPNRQALISTPASSSR